MQRYKFTVLYKYQVVILHGVYTKRQRSKTDRLLLIALIFYWYYELRQVSLVY